RERGGTEARGALMFNATGEGGGSSQLVKPRQAVRAGQRWLSRLPGDGELAADQRVPSRAGGCIERGGRVLLRCRAYPYQKFGRHEGSVFRISRSALNPGELGASMGGNAQQSQPLYRVTVMLAKQAVTAYGNEEPLKPGMLVDADILGDRRKLVEW